MSLERGTENVPDDGHYYLIVRGEIAKRFRNEKAARTEYLALRAVYLAAHPVVKEKVDLERVISDDQIRLSNKELIWDSEDFARVERATKRRR